MQLIDMFFDEIEDAKKRKVPFIIPIGTIEYHAHHASCGTDTMVINGVMRELEKEKEIVVCPPIWYGVASYAVGGPAKKVTMEYMEDTMGRGWWGSNSYADYYENLGTGDDPFSYIKVIPLIGKEAQHKCGGFDHAGKWETSLMMGTYPDHVDLSRCDRNTEWFAKSAVEASEELGHHMVNCTLEWLRETIV